MFRPVRRCVKVRWAPPPRRWARRGRSAGRPACRWPYRYPPWLWPRFVAVSRWRDRLLTVPSLSGDTFPRYWPCFGGLSKADLVLFLVKESGRVWHLATECTAEMRKRIFHATTACGGEAPLSRDLSQPDAVSAVHDVLTRPKFEVLLTSSSSPSCSFRAWSNCCLTRRSSCTAITPFSWAFWNEMASVMERARAKKRIKKFWITSFFHRPRYFVISSSAECFFFIDRFETD